MHKTSSFLVALVISLFTAGSPAWVGASEKVRIVSLLPSMTEIVYALGVEDALVGVDDFSDYPPEATSHTRVGGLYTLSLEGLARLKPTHVLTIDTLLAPEVTDRLQRLDASMLPCRDRDLDDILSCIRVVGDAFDRTEEADALVRQYEDVRRQVGQRVAEHSQPRVLVLVSVSPLYAAGGNSFLGDMVRAAGAENVLESSPQRFPLLGAEALMSLAPDVILVLGGDSRREVLISNPALRRVPAVRDGQVYALPADLYSRAGPRAFKGLSDLAALLHSEP